MRISEVSPNTLEGSFSDDLVLGKLWLIRKLSNLGKDFGTVYVLGSWFGNLGLLMATKELPFKEIVNVDLDGKALDVSDRLVNKLGLQGKISGLHADANHIKYDGLGRDGLVINTSCNNMSARDWADNIPGGVMVALQGRNNDPGAVSKHRQAVDLLDQCRLNMILFIGNIRLRDQDGEYDRYMVIGEK